MPGRFVVVSGGGTGIGKAIAAAFAAEDDRVVILGRRADVLSRARADIHPGRVVAVPADLTDPEQVTTACDQITAMGSVDVLVNNAGANVTTPADNNLAAIADAWRRDLDTNLLTAVLLTSALLDHLRRPGGRLIMISSTAAQRGGSGDHSAGSYAAAKAALHGWAFGLAWPNLPVTIAGHYAGLSGALEGAPHHAITDLAFTRAIPRMRIWIPADDTDVTIVGPIALSEDGPTYLRLCRDPVEPITGDQRVGDSLRVWAAPSADITIVACGVAVGECVRAAKTLNAEGIKTAVVGVLRLKPLPETELAGLISGSALVVTVEEHNIIGGLGSSVAEVVASTTVPRRYDWALPTASPKQGRTGNSSHGTASHPTISLRTYEPSGRTASNADPDSMLPSRSFGGLTGAASTSVSTILDGARRAKVALVREHQTHAPNDPLPDTARVTVSRFPTRPAVAARAGAGGVWRSWGTCPR